MIIPGFVYTDSEVLTKAGDELVLYYGEIAVPGHPSRVRDDYTHMTISAISPGVCSKCSTRVGFIPRSGCGEKNGGIDG